MRNGVVSQRQPLEPLTDASGSGFWPTTTTMDAYGSGGNPHTTGSHGTTLTDRAVRMWGTPVARDDQKSPEAHLAMKARMGGGRTEVTSLTVQAKTWQTPRASMNENRTTQHAPTHGRGHGRTLAGEAAEHGRHVPTTPTDGNDGSPRADLNPRFVAALMGVPWDWLSPFTSVETASFHAWLRSHSVNYSNEPT